MQRAGGNLDEGHVLQSRDVGISPLDAGLMVQVSLCVAETTGNDEKGKDFVPLLGHSSVSCIWMLILSTLTFVRTVCF